MKRKEFSVVGTLSAWGDVVRDEVGKGRKAHQILKGFMSSRGFGIFLKVMDDKGF